MSRRDPRLIVAALLFLYLTLGVTVLGFNRSPVQIAITSLFACALDVVLMAAFRKRIEWPLSALITSFSLSILLNYSHTWTLLFIPVFLAIASKYLFTVDGRHVYNPALFGIVTSLLFMKDLISAAPAYQWNGIPAMALVIVMPALLFLIPNVKRLPLVLSFLTVFTLQCALRAVIMRHHLPFTTLFLGTITSPSFFLFTFFMITDPATSPAEPRKQVQRGAAIALVDLLFHIRQSYHTFFFAGFTVSTIVFLAAHARRLHAARGAYLRETLLRNGWYRRPAMLGAAAICGLSLLGAARPRPALRAPLDFTFVPVPRTTSTIDAHFGDVYDRVDPRIRHIAKWILSVGDAVATGDYDGDGRQDLFFTMPLMRERNSLYRNRGGFAFERIAIAALDARNADPETYGLPAGAMFVDYDGDGDLDLFITYAFGSPVLLRNELRESGVATFTDVTAETGLAHYTNSVAANWLDADGDGHLDLFIANALRTTLPDYATPTPLNLFHLPPPAYAGDRRMFHFMHESWNDANNGGLNELWLGDAAHRFHRQDNVAWNLPETRWSLAVGTGDVNGDGWPDVYVANDFGPDDLYLNDRGRTFHAVRGAMFGSIGRDTYKGMNASLGDLDRNGMEDVYVSNVHHALQGEGSLAWMFSRDGDGLHVDDRATQLGIVNEERFGWGAAIADVNNDGWPDIAQANGMVDDSIDKRGADCGDYWYVNEKLARSAPSIHSYADNWGDIRGMCIFGKEANRLYLNQGTESRPQFVDVAEQTGLTELTNSRGVAAVDLDDDGALDLVITHMFAPPSIYRNTARGPWLRIALPPSAVGARVTLSYIAKSGARVSQMQETHVVNGLSAQSDSRLHFGLGDYARDLTVTTTWRGRTTAFRPPAINREYNLSPTPSSL